MDGIARAYFPGLLKLTALDTLTLAAGLWLTGFPVPIVLALICAVLAWIPYVGSILGGVLVVLVAATDFPGTPTMAYSAVARLLDDFVYMPVTVGHSLRMNPLVTVLMILAGGAVEGHGNRLRRCRKPAKKSSMVNEIQQTLVNAKEMSSTLAFCEYQNDLVVDLFPPGRPASWSRQALWFARTPRHGDLRRVVWCRRPGRSRRVVRRRSGLAQGVSRPSPRHARTRHLWRRLPRTGSGRLRIILKTSPQRRKDRKGNNRLIVLDHSPCG